MNVSDLAKKQPGYKTLRKRLKSREKAIQRLRNKVAWLELQLTLHFVEDRRVEDSDETNETEAWCDDCPKCEQLRNMLDAPLQLPQIPEVLKSEGRLNESPGPVIDPEMTNCRNRNDVMLTIDPSHHSLSLDQRSQQGDTSKVPPEHQGVFSRESHGNICCIFIVAMAILLVSWI